MIRRLTNKLKMQKQYGGKDKFEKALQQQGLTADKYKENLRTAAYHKRITIR